MSDGEISLADLGAGGPPPAPPSGPEISLDEIQGTAPPFDTETEAAISRGEITRSQAEEAQGAFQDKRSFLTKVVSVSKGTTKALVSGAVGLGETALQGVAGLAVAASSVATDQGEPEKAFETGMQDTAKATAKLRDLTSAITGLNLAPASREDEAAQQLLALIPKGITAAGDTVFEKTGSALWGAGTQAALILLTLKPALATKTFGVVKGRIVNPVVKTGFDELAVTNPNAAEQLAEHVGQADPELETLLKKSMEKAQKADPKKVGEAAVEAKTAESEIKFEDLMKEDEISYEELISQATREAKSEEEAPSPLKENASGESAASLEAISRVSQEQSTGQFRYRINRDGMVVPLTGVDAVDAVAKAGETIVQRGVGEGDYTILDRGQRSQEAAQASLAAARSQLDQITTQRLTLNQTRISDGLGDTMKEGYQVLENPPEETSTELNVKKTGNQEWTVYNGKKPIQSYTDEATAHEDAQAIAKETNTTLAAFVSPEDLRKLPGAQVVEGKLKEYADQAIRTFSPESLGPQAKKAAALLSSRIFEKMQKDSATYHEGLPRRKFWNKLGVEQSMEFIKDYEAGTKFSDPELQVAKAGYKAWNEAMEAQDAKLSGLHYEPQENYLYHTFEQSDKLAAYFTQRHGPKWGNPNFIKDRTFDLYQEAIDAGFKPRFTNPEDIMQARQHASNVAQMRVEALRDFEKNGIAWRITEENTERPTGFPAHQWRSPNGEKYWVHDSANAVLSNAFNTETLWNLGKTWGQNNLFGVVGGDLFRGAMGLKNALVPIKLALSAFHPIHIATIDNATAMVRATELLMTGEMNPVKWIGEMTKAVAYTELGKETGAMLIAPFKDIPDSGYHLLQAYKGMNKDGYIAASDVQSLQYMQEGGMIPELSSQFRTNSRQKFIDAIQRGSASAAWHLPWAALSLMGKPIFEVWIPSLKIASYLKDVDTALKMNPALLEDTMARQLAFRQIAKSVDNRYGEMAYNTMFWNRWVKDIAVANTLSLGWQMGFIREYGGGMMDLGQALLPDKRTLAEKVKAGELHRPLFVSFYTASTLLIGGLITWYNTKAPPQQLMDYTHPRTGEKNPDGTDARLNTMFYPREVMALYKHMENEGMVKGISEMAASKSSGLIGQTSEWITGVNNFGQEIRDPNAPAFKQLEQTVSATLFDLEPISVRAIQTGANPALALAGFGPAPKYITESPTSAAIRLTYQKYYAQKQTPYEKAEYSTDTAKLKQYWRSGDSDKFGDLLDKMQSRYELTGPDMRRLEKAISRPGEDPNLSMFAKFDWHQQKRLLDKMSSDERETYLRVANKEHLRFHYEAPETP